ncbi:hypothetical protein M514_13003 [Trichuris suis]|uniref:Uncharacterized protein n=1 Tax=Trichuris suis TaxID=68888 RepID=A0A085MR52_9BILA|nr:hypothetical protein M513_13003 [Trichuris suis]KFD59698.1 hypothetical protein M514_13003 [Trichuris suis]
MVEFIYGRTGFLETDLYSGGFGPPLTGPRVNGFPLVFTAEDGSRVHGKLRIPGIKTLKHRNWELKARDEVRLILDP